MNLHPAATLIPEMTPQEFAALKADIQAHGQREPIVMLGETILDGRHRYRAVEELGYEPVFREYRGDTDESSLVAFVLSQNLHRRHLTESQRAMIAARIANGKRGDNQYTMDADKSVSTSKAARLLKVSADSVQNARKVQQQGAAVLQRAVEQGKVAVTTAAALADASKAEQKQIIALHDEKEIIARAKEIKERRRTERREKRRNELLAQAANFQIQPMDFDPCVDIHCDDARNLNKYVEAHSAQLVITSPPYNVGIEYDGYRDQLPIKEYLALLRATFQQYYRALCDGGRIAVIVPFGVERSPWIPFAARIHDLLVECKFTARGWLVWDKMTAQNRTSWGSDRSFTSPHVRDMCEAIIVMHKGSSALAAPKGALLDDEVGKYSPFLQAHDYFAELSQNVWHVKPETTLNGKHPAPFPVELAARLIHFYAYPNALIVDGMAGSGSVGIAAKQNGCRAVLVEQSPLYCALVQERLTKGK